MKTQQYPINIEKDGEGYLLTFPDFEDAVTGGDTIEEAISNAEGALCEVIAARIAHKEKNIKATIGEQQK